MQGELKVVEDKFFLNGNDVTKIVDFHGDYNVSLMGYLGGRSYHSYFGLDGKRWYPYTGVTTILGVVGDKSNLIQWAADKVVEKFGWSKQAKGELAADYRARLFPVMEKAIEDFKMLSLADCIKYVIDARTNHAKFAKSTANLGKKVHSQIEEYINICIANNEGFAFATKLDASLAESVQSQHFVDWAVAHKVKFYKSELKLFSRKYWYAGTCDFIAEIDGKMYMGDIKTTNYVFGRTYYAQCAAYRLAYCETEKLPENHFAGSVIVKISRDGLFNPDADILYSHQYEDDKRFFLAALEVYRQENGQFGTKSFDEKEMVDLSKQN